MKRLVAALLFLAIPAGAERLGATYNPSFGGPDYYTLIDTNTIVPGTNITESCTAGACTINATGGGGGSTNGTVNAAPTYDIGYYSGAGSTTTIDGSANLKVFPSSITVPATGGLTTTFGMKSGTATVTSLLPNQVTFAGTAGLLSGSNNFQWDGSSLSVHSIPAANAAFLADDAQASNSTGLAYGVQGVLTHFQTAYGTYGSASRPSVVNTGVAQNYYGAYGTASGGQFTATGSPNVYGAYGAATCDRNWGTTFGLYGQSTGCGSTPSYGGYFDSTGGSTNYGVYINHGAFYDAAAELSTFSFGVAMATASVTNLTSLPVQADSSHNLYGGLIDASTGTVNNLPAARVAAGSLGSSVIASSIAAASVYPGALTGTINAAQFPSLTGDITTSAGSLATTAAALQANIKTISSSLTVTNASGLNTTYGASLGSATLRNVASGTQCLHADGSGNVTGTGSDCGSGGGGGGIVSPATFTWTNTFGMSMSTLTLTTGFTNNGSYVSTATYTQGTYNATTANHLIFFNTTSSSGTLNLPSCSSSAEGLEIIVKDWKGNAATNNILIDPNGADTVDQITTKTITTNSSAYWLRCDGVNNWSQM